MAPRRMVVRCTPPVSFWWIGVVIRGYYDALAPDAVTKVLADANHLFREQPK